MTTDLGRVGGANLLVTGMSYEAEIVHTSSLYFNF